ncbi:MAG: MoaF N-terminal domain-containing protein [Acidobacteriota bacterium]|jgi:hypothetical protein|nr:MoaF N-terminal domain-containing protein [Acidobacteriota bacterium]
MMDLRKFRPQGGNDITQYCPPLCFELAGQKLELQMDNGYDILLNFIDGKSMEWSWIGATPAFEPWMAHGKSPKKEAYECLKGDDTTYLVSYVCANIEPRVNHVWVIDMEKMLVTRVFCAVGKNPRWPLLITPEVDFGCIKQPGVEYKAYPRHGFSGDMIGNVVQWRYGSELSTVHAYYDPYFYRITYPLDNTTAASKKTSENMNTMVNALPSSDEPINYIKIKDGLYLTVQTESYMEKIRGAAAGFRSDTFCFLENFKRVSFIGRGFGTMTNRENGKEINSPIHIMIGTYGNIIDQTKDPFWEKFTTDPNPYLVN